MAHHLNYQDAPYRPRSEAELCALFSDLVFMRYDQGLSHAELSAGGRQTLLTSNLINRIFRAWYQIAWGDTSWNDAFAGETPRQELSALYPDIENGKAMLSVVLTEFISSPYMGNCGVGTRLEATPKLFTEKDLQRVGGAFLYGLAELKIHNDAIVAPNYDPGFRIFAERLQQIKAMAESLPSYALRDLPDEVVYWRLFIEDTSFSILSSLPLIMRDNDRERLRNEFVTVLLGAMGMQKDGEVEYFSIDTLFGHFWTLFSHYDHELVSYKQVLRDSLPSDRKRGKKSTRLDRSRAVLYRLGCMFDEKFLFPADRYFNAVEIVWQDKKTFMNNLYVTIDTMNKNTTHAEFKDEPDPKLRELFNVTHTMGMLENLFFNPPTCFRVYDWALAIV